MKTIYIYIYLSFSLIKTTKSIYDKISIENAHYNISEFLSFAVYYLLTSRRFFIKTHDIHENVDVQYRPKVYIIRFFRII